MAKGKEKDVTKASPKPKANKSEKSAKATKAPAPKAPAPKAANLSQEYVADSDDEDAPAEAKRVKKVNTKASTPAKTPATPKRPAIKPEPASESEVESAEDLPKDPVPRKPDQQPAKVNGVKRKTEDSSSSEEESEEEDLGQPEAKKTKQSAAVKKDSSAEESEESSGSSESEEDEMDQEGTKPQSTSKPPSPPKSRPVAPTQVVAPPIVPTPFQPPSGYIPVDLSSAATNTDWSQDSLQGKQIWHIAAPSDVPISAITEVALDAIQSGVPVLSHKGADYVLSEDTLGTETNFVMQPGREGYKPIQQRVGKSLHLQQKINLPNLSARQKSLATGSAAAGDIAEAAVKTVRPQPKGLRMRYTPLGSGSGIPGTIGSDSDSDEQDNATAASKAFQFPRALGAHGTSGHSLTAKNTAHDAETSSKKAKKKRKEKQQDLIAHRPINDHRAGATNADAGAAQAQAATETVAAAPEMKVVMPEVAAQTPVTNGGGGDEVSEEARARRKEEKRKRKEAAKGAVKVKKEPVRVKAEPIG
ncbi:hypothetical protein B0A50_01402 [Salinomyces thailandicus]|uniref:DNA-directed RNA polymerase I subunit RPA34.5-domain-containing protein n=1 Tax=Salinomyces thailandicus TaxID=706561 RepID=A0A4U0UAC7_9PEZI|nr:hypothetical protein B0A50_01402 [Salinomyces thailandica]